MADDLDDDWWAPGNDAGKEGSASDEDGHDGEGVMSTRDEDAGASSDGNDDDDDDDDVNGSAEKGTKRKAGEADASGVDGAPKKKKKKKRKTKTEELAERGVQPLAPGDLIRAIEKHYKDKLSAIEWDEVKLEEENFALCNDMSYTANSYLKHVLPKWKKLTSSTAIGAGSPLLLIITASAIRATQLNRDIVEFKKECKVAKLFAKHMKVKDQVKYLQKSVVHIGLGTPSRIATLIDNKSLKLDNVTHVVLDWSWRDSKLRRLFELPEIRENSLSLLREHIFGLLRSGQTKLGLM